MYSLSFAIFLLLPPPPSPGLCLGSCMISAFLNLRKIKIKNFTVLKPHVFFCYRSLAVLLLSGSYFVVYAIDPILSSEI